MGFTRYWEFESLDSEKFKDFSSICQTLIDSMNISLEDVTVNETQVRFNGVDEDSSSGCIIIGRNDIKGQVTSSSKFFHLLCDMFVSASSNNETIIIEIV